MTDRPETAARRIADTPNGHPARRGRPLTVDEVLALPASVDIETTARCLNIGRDKAHRLIRQGEFPIRVLPLGGKHRCRLIDICEWLGLPAPTP